MLVFACQMLRLSGQNGRFSTSPGEAKCKTPGSQSKGQGVGAAVEREEGPESELRLLREESPGVPLGLPGRVRMPDASAPGSEPQVLHFGIRAEVKDCRFLAGGGRRWDGG